MIHARSAGPIEKGANDGQTTYATDLVKALKAGVLSRPRAGTANSKLKAKGKRKKTDIDSPKKIDSEHNAKESLSGLPDHSWGVFEPLHAILGTLVDILRPLISANMVIGFLSFLLVITWLRGSATPSGRRTGRLSITSPERFAAYEEIWRKEESNLWDWLEERIGMEDNAYPTSSEGSDHEAVRTARKQREQGLKHRDIATKIVDERMSEIEFAEAIKVTEERLEVLKSATEQKKKKKRMQSTTEDMHPPGE